MRARTVNEYQSFNRGVDPKRALGLGPDPRVEEDFVSALLQALPEILGTREIPSDIIVDKLSHINPLYQKRLTSWVGEYISSRLGDEAAAQRVETLGYNIWKSLHYRLKNLGYSDDPGLDESLSFQRGVDPKRAMGLGVDPRNEKVFVQYIVSKLPEMLSHWKDLFGGPAGVPYDILKDRALYIRREYFNEIEGPIKAYASARLSLDSSVDSLENLPYNFWRSLANDLRALGYRS